MRLLDEDLRAAPWRYPGTPAPGPGLLHDGAFRPGGAGLDDALARLGLPRLPARRPVVAVGSNASPGVMHRKFAAGGVSTTVPFTTVRLTGLRVGHSAHVSAAGYVAAAPVADPGSPPRTFVVTFLDADQVACLDATEPNYMRVTRRAGRGARRGSPVAEPEARHDLYVSRRGVLAPPSAPPLELRPQHDLLPLLARAAPALLSLLEARPDPAEAGLLLRSDAALRDLVRAQVRASGWVAASGLEPAGSGRPDRKGLPCASSRSSPTSASPTCLPPGTSTPATSG